jgi:hypothetical protein
MSMQTSFSSLTTFLTNRSAARHPDYPPLKRALEKSNRDRPK